MLMNFDAAMATAKPLIASGDRDSAAYSSVMQARLLIKHTPDEYNSFQPY